MSRMAWVVVGVSLVLRVKDVSESGKCVLAQVQLLVMTPRDVEMGGGGRG